MNLKEILLQICKENNYISYSKYGITIELVVDILCSNKPLHSYLCSTFRLSKNTVTTALKNIFPDRDYKPDNDIRLWLLRKKNLKLCNKCNLILDISDFYTNISKPKGTNSFCKICSKDCRRKSYHKDPRKEIVANKIRKINKNTFQTPIWADLHEIEMFYRLLPKGCHVDHIIPLNNSLVCGLHVRNNLQYLSIEENLKKSNKYTIE